MRLSKYEDGIPIVASDAERTARFPSPDTNQRVWNRTTRREQRYTGTRWVDETASPFVRGRSDIEIIAHRGFSGIAPENTLAAISAGAGLAHSVEFDVCFSSDGEAVVIHDSTVDRTTDGTGSVSDLTLAALQALDAGSWFDARFTATRIPTFEDALRLAAEHYRWIYPEIKDVRSLSDVTTFMDVIMAADLEDRCIVTSFLTDRLDAARDISSRIVLGYTADSDETFESIQAPAIADGNAICFVNYQVLLDNAADVHALRQSGVDCVAWTVNTLDVARQLAAIGVTRLCGDLLVQGLVSR